MKQAYPLICLLAAVASIGMGGNDQNSDTAKPTTNDWHDVVLLTDARPFLIRLRISVHGSRFTHTWHRALDAVFDFLDDDRDGKLNRKEIACAPHPSQLLQQLQDRPIDPAPAPAFFSSNRHAVKNYITRKQFIVHYQKMRVGPVFLDYGKRIERTDRLHEKMFSLLDSDRDGKLSRTEIHRAPDLMRKLDSNVDEIVSVREILGRPAGQSFVFRPALALEPQLLLVRSAIGFGFAAMQSGQSVTKKVMEKYDGNNDRKLSNTEVRISRKVFRQFDRNGDGMWSQGELEARLQGPPDLEAILRLGRPGTVKKKALSAIEVLRSNFKTYLVRHRALAFDANGLQVKILTGGANDGRPSQVGNGYLARFRARDNGDKILDAKEIYRPPFEWTGVLRLVDRNGDDCISQRELADYTKLTQRCAGGSARLTIVERAPSLFEIIDADHDGQLGLRDLKTAWTQLKRWDKNRDGFIAANELPKQLHLAASFGRPISDNQPSRAPGYGPAQRPLASGEGPRWFQAMDANRDADLSPREFLGSRQMFRRIDRDNDGLIDRYEAEKAPIAAKTGKKTANRFHDAGNGEVNQWLQKIPTNPSAALAWTTPRITSTSATIASNIASANSRTIKSGGGPMRQ